MEEEVSLPFGRDFERRFIGINGGHGEIPTYLDFSSAMQQVTKTPLTRSSLEDGVSDELYNPMEPNWGLLGQLWLEVRKHLPRRSEGVKSGPLSLHISIGTSLDYHHGVDCFFWWMGVYLTIDASLVPKEKRFYGKEHLKADLLIKPEDVTPLGLVSLGKKIADQLRKRRHLSRKMSQRERRTLKRVHSANLG